MKRNLSIGARWAAVLAMVTAVFAQGAHSPLHHLRLEGSRRVEASEPARGHRCGHAGHNHHASEGGDHQGHSHEGPGQHSHDCELCRMLSRSLATWTPPVPLAGPELSEILSQRGARQYRLDVVEKPFSRGPPALA